MKPLLMCASSSRTGPVEGLISLAAELRSLGVTAHFAGDTVRPGEDLPGYLRAASVPFEAELRLSRKVRLLDVLHDARLLSRWVREGRFDVLHAAFAHDHLVALWAARSSDAIVVRAAQRRADLQRLWQLRRSDGVVVHAEQYRRALVDAGLPEDRVAYVPPSVDAARFSPGASELRTKWGIPLRTRLAGIVARMKPERGHEALLRAFARAVREVPDAALVLVGRGEDEWRLREIAARLAPAQIVFGGYSRGVELIDAYRALDVAVWLREGNDGATRGVLEAMACGVPVIAGSDGASGELVRDGLDGAVVAPDDEAAIAAALIPLLRDPARSTALGQGARDRALTFTPARAAAATLEFWERLRGALRGARAPRPQNMNG
jgi:glycosyltransferase involved in cell wall biosynthesis